MKLKFQNTELSWPKDRSSHNFDIILIESINQSKFYIPMTTFYYMLPCGLVTGFTGLMEWNGTYRVQYCKNWIYVKLWCLYWKQPTPDPHHCYIHHWRHPFILIDWTFNLPFNLNELRIKPIDNKVAFTFCRSVTFVIFRTVKF